MNTINHILSLIRLEGNHTAYFPPETGPLILKAVLDKLAPQNRIDWLICREVAGLQGKLAAMKILGLTELDSSQMEFKTAGKKELYRFSHPKPNTDSNKRIVFMHKVDSEGQAVRVQLVGIGEWDNMQPFLKTESRYLSIRLNTLVNNHLLNVPTQTPSGL